MKYLLVLFSIIFLLGCSKDSRKVKYRVVSQSNSEVIYSMKGGPLNSENVSGDWSKTFRSRSGNPLYLSATKTSPFGTLTIQISIDGNVVFSQSTEEMFSPITIDAVVP
jgi:hypothetical protein